VSYVGPHWGLIDRNVIGSPVAALRSGPYEGASVPPLGVGSLGLTVGSGTEKVAFGNEVDFVGNLITGITALSFQIFWTGEDKVLSASNLASVQFEVDPSGPSSGVSPNYSSLVFVPNGTALPTNTFNLIDATSDTAGWWFFTNGTTAATTGCDQSGANCTYSQMQAAVAANYPQMSVITMSISKGRDYAFQGAVDALRYNGFTYDFEPFGVTAIPAP
jgi:hypothetical protein